MNTILSKLLFSFFQVRTLEVRRTGHRAALENYPVLPQLQVPARACPVFGFPHWHQRPSPLLSRNQARLCYVQCLENPLRWMSLSQCVSPPWTQVWIELPCSPARTGTYVQWPKTSWATVFPVLFFDHRALWWLRSVWRSWSERTWLILWRETNFLKKTLFHCRGVEPALQVLGLTSQPKRLVQWCKREVTEDSTVVLIV